MFDQASNAAFPVVYAVETKVQDFEVDKHGAVANFRYAEIYADFRDAYLRAAGIDIDVSLPVVMEAHLKYAKFLGPNERYRLELRVKPERLGYTFLAEIHSLDHHHVSNMSEILILFVKDKSIVRRPIAQVGTVIGLA